MAGCRLSVVRFRLARRCRELDLDEAGRAVSPKAEVLRDPPPDHPGDPPASDQQGDPCPLLARDLRVHKEILELLLTRHPERPEPIPRAPAPERERRLQEERTEDLPPRGPANRTRAGHQPSQADPAVEGGPPRPGPRSDRNLPRRPHRSRILARSPRCRRGRRPDPDHGPLAPSLAPAREGNHSLPPGARHLLPHSCNPLTWAPEQVPGHASTSHGSVMAAQHLQ